MQWGSWSTLSENADPRLLGQVAVQLRVPRKLSEDTEHRGAVDSLSLCAEAKMNYI